MQLVLNRPIVILDFEATGVDTMKDKIVEIGAIKIHPDGKAREHFSTLVNPGRLLSDEIVELTGITNEELAKAPVFGRVAHAFHDFVKDCDIGGFGVEFFDIPLGWEELYREGIVWNLDGVMVVDSLNIFKRMEARNLAAAVIFYLGRNHDGAHRAITDSEATADVLLAQVARYQDLPRTLPELAKETTYKPGRIDLAGKFATNKDGIPVFTFGMKKDRPVSENIDYLGWMLRNDFSQNTKMHAKKMMGSPYRMEAMAQAQEQAPPHQEEPEQRSLL